MDSGVSFWLTSSTGLLLRVTVRENQMNPLHDLHTNPLKDNSPSALSQARSAEWRATEQKLRAAMQNPTGQQARVYASETRKARRALPVSPLVLGGIFFAIAGVVIGLALKL